MSIQMKKNSAIEKFEIFLEWIKPELINSRQFELLNDCKDSLKADYDSEITYLSNCQRIIER
jgi:hypothetical protein